MNIIIYGSQYGTARLYAEELGRRTGTEVSSYKDPIQLDNYSCIIYIGALYAGGVLGMQETLGKLSSHDGKRLIIATVGLADPKDVKNTDSIRNSIKQQLPPELFEKAQIYHLRGGIDYSCLSVKHRTMMWLVYKKALKVPESERTAEIRAMIETYDKQVNFIDFTSLDKITNSLKHQVS